MARGKFATNLVGQQFGKLVVVARAENASDGGSRWLCQCECGRKPVVHARSLRTGAKSCRVCCHFGWTNHRTHGMARTKLYKVWDSMKQRCLNSNHPSFKDYGGRGIIVCQRWLKFENFAADMGKVPAGLTIERKNNDGGYEPSNCCWATRKEQRHNQRKKTKE